MRIVNICTVIIIILLISSDLNSQTLEQVNKKLDSLSLIQKDKQNKIDNLQKSLNSIVGQIKKYEAIKTRLMGNKNELNKKIKARVVHEGGVLRVAPFTGSENIGNIKENEDIYILGYERNLYFKVQYKQKTGYLIYSSIETNPEVDKILADENLKNQPTIVRQVDLNDPKYLRLSKVYSKEIALRLMNQELWEGMSPGMILESAGKPVGKTNNKTDSGLMEQWNYTDKILYLENGELKRWIKK